MAEPTPPTPGPIIPDDPVRRRRSQADPEQLDTVTFAKRGLPPERLEALKAFLKSASGDEIAAIRRQYADSPEVLRLIGLEVLSKSSDKLEIESTQR